MTKASEKLIVAVKLNETRAYKIAHKADLHPSTLSKIICGICHIKENDPRVIKIGAVLGLSPEECFTREV